MTRPTTHQPVQRWVRGSQRGLSLIEMMVGLAIGLLVVLAAMGTIVINRQAGTTVSDGYKLANAGNSAMRLIASSVRQAGAMELAQAGGVGNNVMFVLGVNRGTGAGGDILVSGTEGAVGAPDTLVASYQHRLNGAVDANVTRDCLGASPGNVAALITNTFSVNNVELRCTGSVTPGAPQAMVGDNANAANDVAVMDFQVWYWMSDQVTGLGTLQRRLTAAEVTAAGGWGLANGGWAGVNAVEVCLHLRGIRSDYPGGGTFNNCAGTNTNFGGRLHQVFRGTYKVRNAIL